MLSRNNNLVFKEYLLVWLLEISVSNFYTLLFRNIPSSPSWE